MDLGGRTLGGYAIVAGSASLDSGRHLATRDGVEVVLTARVAADDETAIRWLTAARSARALDHPAAARVLDAGQGEDRLVWVVTEKLEGTSLDELCRAAGPLPAPRFLPLFDALCDAVARAHEAGIYHGDLRAERMAVSVAAGRLVLRSSAFGTTLAVEAPTAADDLLALAELARDSVENGRALVGDDAAARPQGPVALAAAVRAAAGLVAPAAAPRLDAGLRARLLAEAPQPLAEAVAALDAARGPDQALAAVRGVARVLCRYLGALALAARSRTGAASGWDRTELAADLRALRSRSLEDAEWLALARDLCVPFFHQPELHPVPALPAFLRDAAPTLGRLFEVTSLPDALADLAAVLEAGRWLLEHRLVVPHGDRAEVWMGIRRARPLTVALASPIPEGWPVILDPSGPPALSLYPLVQVAEPAPGEPAEVFLLSGPGPNGARLESLPSGAILDDQRLWSWFGENVLEMSAQITAVDVNAPPWRGLLPYGPEHAPRFFGREREARALVNRLRVEPIVTVVGAAGSGKTSLVQAGVVPSLPRGWRVLTVRPGASPLTALADAVGDPALRPRLSADPDALGRALRAAAGDERVLLVVDPIDELFSRCSDEVERRETALCLARAARSPADPVRLLCVVRDEALVRLEGSPGWRERVARGLHVCATPASDDLVRILVEPLRQSAHEFEETAVPEALAAECAGLPDGLARLSLLASLLWERRVELRIPSAAARGLGGAGGILERHVQQALAPLSFAERTLVPAVVAGKRDDPALRARLVEVGLLRDDGEPQHEVLRPLLLERPAVAIPIVVPPPTGWMRMVAVAGLFAAAVGLAIAVVRAGDRQTRLDRDRLAAVAETGAAEGRVTDGLVERGRRSLLAGDARAAATDLREAARRGARGEALDLLRARAEAGAAGERLHLRQAGTVWMAGFSPDGTRIVTAGEDGTARVWDGRTGQLAVTLTGHQGTVWSARWSADGTRLVTGGDDGTVRVWDAAAGSSLAVLTGHERAVLDAVFTGDRVVSFSLDGTVRLWDGEAARTLARGATSFAVGAGGRRIIAGDGNGDARVFDPARTAPVATLGGHGEAVLSVGVSADGRHACTGSGDHTLRIWDTASGRLLHEGREHGGEVTGCAFSADGARLATTAADHTAKVWDVGSGDLLFSLAHRGEVSRAVFSPDGTRLVTASSDGSARLWDAATGRPRGTLSAHDDSVWWVGWDMGGKQIVTAGLDGTARVWDAHRDPLLATLSGHSDAVTAARFSRDGARVVTASRDRTARLWDAASGAELVVLGHDEPVRSAELSPDGATVLTASKDGRARIWRVTGGAPLVVVTAGGPLSCARFAPDGKRFATGEERGPVTIWDARGGPSVVTLPATGVLDVRWSPDGGRLVVAQPGGVAQVWDASGRPLAKLEGHRLDVQAAAWSADGKQIVTAGSDRTARLWDAATGRPGVVFRGHTHELRQAELSPSRALVLTAAGDGTARLWDARTGMLLDILEGHADWVYGAAFSPDGARVVTAGGDRTARIWDVRPAPGRN